MNHSSTYLCIVLSGNIMKYINSLRNHNALDFTSQGCGNEKEDSCNIKHIVAGIYKSDNVTTPGKVCLSKIRLMPTAISVAIVTIYRRLVITPGAMNCSHICKYTLAVHINI